MVMLLVMMMMVVVVVIFFILPSNERGYAYLVNCVREWYLGVVQLICKVRAQNWNQRINFSTSQDWWSKSVNALLDWLAICFFCSVDRSCLLKLICCEPVRQFPRFVKDYTKLRILRATVSEGWEDLITKSDDWKLWYYTINIIRYLKEFRFGIIDRGFLYSASTPVFDTLI